MQKKFSQNHPREMAPESEQPCEFGLVHNQGFEQEFHNDVNKPEQGVNIEVISNSKNKKQQKKLWKIA